MAKFGQKHYFRSSVQNIEKSKILRDCKLGNRVLYEKGLMSFFCQVARNGFFWPKRYLKFFFFEIFCPLFRFSP